jgi:uncharacterized protein YegL
MEERIGPVRETKAFEQLGILLLDGSGSMASEGETRQSKAAEVSLAVRGLLTRMKGSRRADSFQLAIVTYDHRVTPRLEPTPVADIDDTADYNPLTDHGGETAIGDALEKASSMAVRFLDARQEFGRSVVIVMYTDGQNNSGKDPVGVAEEIKRSGKEIKICAAGFGKPEEVDSLTLQKLVTKPSGYILAHDGESLRKFFEESIFEARE